MIKLKKGIREEFIWPLIIFIFAAFLRLVWLDRIPGAITGDQLNYIIPAKSVAISGQDLTFGWSIFNALFFSYPTVLPQAELPYFLVFPFVALFPISLFTVTLPFALISAATASAMYILVNHLLGKRAATAAGLIAAVNPWQMFMGRTPYDVAVAPFFYILGIYFLVSEKGWRILIALPIFMLAFYSYIGTKTILIPIVLITSIYAYLVNKKKYARQYLIINLLLFIFVAFFALSLLGGGSRAGELALPTDPQIGSQVNDSRKFSYAPQDLKLIFENKFTVYAKIILTKTVNSFSPEHLFIAGDNFTALYRHGLFYFIDGVFLILGLGFMLAKKSRAFVLIASLIVVSTAPHVLHTLKTEVFTPHLTLFFTLLIIPISYGISGILKQRKKALLIIILIIYALSFSRFLYIYFFQYPLYGHFDLPSRIVSKYVSLAAARGVPVDVYVNSAHDIYSKYLFYTDSMNSQNFQEIKASINSEKYSLKNIDFIPCGDFAKRFDPNAVSIYHSVICDDLAKATASAKIARLDDGGEIFKIYNDNVCQSFSLKGYPSDLKMSDFSIENLPAKSFCETFIIQFLPR